MEGPNGIEASWRFVSHALRFGAGVAVDFIEGTMFETYINPYMIGLFETIIPWTAIQTLFVGEYGLITLGVRYAVAIILPIVTFFFAVFAIIVWLIKKPYG